MHKMNVIVNRWLFRLIRDQHVVFSFFLFFVVLPLQAQNYYFRLPVSAVVTDEDHTGKTWKQNGLLPVTYTAAVNQVKASMFGQGWRMKQMINLAKNNDRAILSFEKGKQKVMIMVWKISIDRTGFSWGIDS